MSLVGKHHSQDEQVRHVQELQRRDETKLPDQAGGASTYQITEDDLNNNLGAGTGWFPEGYPFPAFVRQGDLVILNGSFQFFATYATSPSLIIKVGRIPAEFRPNRFARTFSGGFGFTDDRLWTIYIWSDGRMTLADMHGGIGGLHPNAAWGNITDGANHALNIDTVYPAIDLGLGSAPP